MRKEIRDKLADILDRVKDPENGTSVAQMNLVAGIKYNNLSREFEVYMNSVKSAKARCALFQLHAYSVMEKEFPNDTVVLKNFKV